MRNILIPFVFLSFSATSFSQTEQMLVPGDLKQQTIVTEPATLRKGYFRLGGTASFAVADKLFDKDGKKDYIPESAWAMQWSYMLIPQYGITDRLQVEVWIPFSNEVRNYYQKFIVPGMDTVMESSWDLKGRGLGDITIGVAYQLMTEEGGRPSLEGAVDVTLPTGEKNPTNVEGDYQFDLPTGYGETTVGLDLRTRKVIYPFSLSGYVHYIYHFKGKKKFSPQDTYEKEFKSGGRLDVGASCNFHLNEWIALANELNYYYSGKGEQEGVSPDDLYSSRGLSYEGRLVFQVRRFRIGQGVRIPLSGKYGPADPLYVILAQYTF